MDSKGYSLDVAKTVQSNPELLQDYENWKEGGAYRVAAHGAVGALSGNLQGALGAAASAAAVPEISDAVNDIGLPDPLRKSLIALAGTAVGAVAGGDAGAAAGFNQTTNNYLKHEEAFRMRALVQKCTTGCSAEERAELQAIVEKDIATTKALDACRGSTTPSCNSVRADFAQAAASYLPASEEIKSWAQAQSAKSNGKYTAAQIADAYRANFTKDAPSESTPGELDTVADWVREQLLQEPPLSKMAMGMVVGTNASLAAAYSINVGGTVAKTGKTERPAEAPVKPPSASERWSQLDDLFNKNVAKSELSLGGKTYTATAESNKTGSTKVFDTSSTPEVKLKSEVEAFVSQLTGSAQMTPKGNPPTVWTTTMPDGTIINMRTASRSLVGGAGGKPARWTVDIIQNPAITQTTQKRSVEIKFK